MSTPILTQWSLILACAAVSAAAIFCSTASAAMEPTKVNLAPAAKAVTSFVSGHESLDAIADGHDPRNSGDHSKGAYGNWPEKGTQWIEYEWTQPVSLNGSDVYWWDDHRGVRLPKAARLSYWDGKAYVPITGSVGVEPNTFNATQFDAISTTKIRLEMDGAEQSSTGVIEWRVYDSGTSPAFPPKANAGLDRTVVLPAATYLRGGGKGIQRPGDQPKGKWSKLRGPGDVTFANPDAPQTTATFSTPGAYALGFTYELRGLSDTDEVLVTAQPKPAEPADKLRSIHPAQYQISSPFWRQRLKNQIVNWIPHCVAMNDQLDLKEGGINNLLEAGKKLRGEPAKPHIGYPFSNAWVLNTAEAMCVALTVDPQGDADIIRAQDAFRAKLEEWIPIILAAQEPDGYFQTRYTLGTARDQRTNYTPKRWNPALRGEHEGYVAGYFIEMGIAHHIATHGKDRRLFDAAIRLADCWVDHIGPAPKQPWFDGHQEMEQALVRLGRYINDTEGAGKGLKYIDLAKFLLDQRGLHEHKPAPTADTGDFYTGSDGGSEYDQSHAPITQQYAAVGHAVRAAYTYSAMADVAMETGDVDYWSGTLSLWDNLVNRKYYVTGGIGSGETSEGFGGDYSLPSGSAYVESCSSCGLLYMQHKLNLATRDGRYADLYETTLYNAILGSTDLEGQNFIYTNSLDSDEARYKWHVCPCCVGNIPRTLLMLPTWMYATASDSLFVNLFVGSTVDVGAVAGTPVQVVQTTDYPWGGKVKIAVNPQKPTAFKLHVRSPRREISTLYRASPNGDGILSLSVNGSPVDAKPNAHGYVTLDREWKAGDVVELELPLPVQRIAPSEKIAATRGRVALRRGPLIYNVESVDQNVEANLSPDAELLTEWKPDMLEGVFVVRGKYADGSSLLAIPNYVRLNRGGRSLVWIRN
jgi:hypothetical protein